MTSGIQLKAQSVAALVIRSFAFVECILLSKNVGAFVWAYFTAQTTPDGHRWFLSEVMPRLASTSIEFGIFAILFVFSNRIARMISPSDDSVVLEGDLFGLVTPLLQILGIIFLAMAASGLFPIVHEYYQHTENPALVDLGQDFWAKLWGLAVHSIVGYLLFADPRWIVARMRRLGFTQP